jgi:uncharacterized membrane protein
MKRRRERSLAPAERRSLLLVAAFLTAFGAMAIWFQVSSHEWGPAREIPLPAGADLRISIAELSSGRSLLYKVEGNKDEGVRVFAKREADGRLLVTFATCRRCDRTRHESHVWQGRLICGHCGEPMPFLEKGATLPKEKDCTPFPVSFEVQSDVVLVRAVDLAAGLPLFPKK